MKKQRALNANEVDTFFSLILDVYKSFAKVMETGTLREKKEASEKFNEIQAMIASKLKDFQEKKGFNFRNIEKTLLDQKGEVSEKFLEVKETILSYHKKLQPYTKKKSVKSRKRLGKRLQDRA